MSDNIKILKNYLLYFSTLLLICIIGISNVFADTTIDTANWVDISGRNWSITGLEYSSAKSFNNVVLLNNYNITGGIYTPPNQFDYITFSFFEHNTSVFNPCNSTSKFTATFRFLFTTPSFVNYVDSVKWGNDNCSITNKNTSTGWVDVSCVASPSTGNYTDIFVNYTTISGTNTSNLYITRNIDIACGLNTDAIINNDNANTQNIINNNSQNTQDIINNNDENTQKIIDSNKENFQTCRDSINLFNKDNANIINVHLNDSSTISNSPSNRSLYIQVQPNTTYTISRGITGNPFVVGTTENIPASGLAYSNRKSNQNGKNITITTGSNDNYLIIWYWNNSSSPFTQEQILNTLQIEKGSVVTDYEPYGEEICTNKLDEQKNAINNLDDTINDDDTTGAESEASEFFSSFDTETFGLTSIITAPLNLIRSVLSSTCTELELPLPYLDNKKLELPCMSTIYSEFFGSFFTIYQTITYGIIAYWVCVRIFNQVKDFKNPEHDEIEVMDL